MDDAPQVDVDQPAPFGEVAEHASPAAHPGVVHQDGDLAEVLVGEVPQPLDVLGVADVDDASAHVAPVGGRRDQRLGALERGRVRVGQHDLHAEAGEGFRGGEADAARRAGDHRDAAALECGMERHERVPS